MRTLYRKFASGELNQEQLPMQGKRKTNGHQEKRGKQSFKRSVRDRDHDHPDYQDEFGRRYNCWATPQKCCHNTS